MATKTYRLGAGADGNFAALSESDQAAASRTDGWTVAKLAAAQMSEFDAGTKQASGSFSATAKPASFLTGTTANALKSPTALSGTFSNASWALTFAVRAVTLSAQRGRMRLRVFKSVNASGASATELTGATQIGTTSAVLSTSADVTTVVTWSPGAAITLNNEYLFFVIAWEITTASGSNSSDVVLRTGSAGGVGTQLVTSDFVPLQAVGSRVSATVVRGITLSGTGTVSVAIGRISGIVAASSPVTDYEARWDASVLSDFTIPHTWGDANSFGAWADRTGVYTLYGGDVNGYYAPDYGPQTINGIAVASFTGGSAAHLPYEYAAVNFPPSFALPQTTLVVARHNLVGYGVLFGANTYGPQLTVNAVAGKLSWTDVYIVNNKLAHPTSIVAGQPFLAASSFDGSTLKLRLNGDEASTTYSRGAWTPATMTMLCESISGAELLIAEVVFFDRLLSASEMAAMEAWLNGKWIASPGTSVVRGVIFTLGPQVAPIGTCASATVVRGVTLAPGLVTVAIGKRAAITSVKGVTLAPGPVTVSVGKRTTATTVRGVTLAPGPVTFTIGRRTAATTARGITLAPGSVMVLIGRRVAATAVSGLTFVLPSQAVPIGKVGGGAALLDNFNRADASSLGANYQQVGFILADPSIVSNQAFVAPGGTEVTAIFNAASFGADQEMAITLAQGDGSGAHLYMYLNVQTSPDDLYLIDFGFGSGSISNGSLDVIIYRRNSSSWTTVTSSPLGSYAWAAGDVWGVKKVGSDIQIKKNGVVLSTYTDPAPLTHGGFVGFGGRASSNIKLDDLSTGGGAPTTTVRGVVIIQGVQNFPVTLAGSMTISPALVKSQKFLRVLPVSATMTPALTRNFSKQALIPLSVTLTAAMSRKLSALRALPASTTLVPAVTPRKLLGRLLVASTTLLPSLASTSKRLRSMAATTALTPAWTVFKGRMINLSASSTFALTMKRLIGKALVANLNFTPMIQKKMPKSMVLSVTLTPVVQPKLQAPRLFASVAVLQVTLQKSRSRAISLSTPIPFIAAMGVFRTSRILLAVSVAFDAMLDYLLKIAERLAKPVASLFSTTVDEAQLLGVGEEIPELVSVGVEVSEDAELLTVNGMKSELVGASVEAPSLRSVS